MADRSPTRAPPIHADDGAGTVVLVPLVGPFHLRLPRYNAVTVRDTLREIAPDALATTELAPGALDDPRWQDTPEVVLPLAVAPWAAGRGLPLVGVHEPSPDPQAGDDFARYLARYPQARALLGEVEAARRALAALLEEPLDLGRVLGEAVPAARAYLELREAHFEDGPGTDWLRRRSGAMAERVAALARGGRRVAALVGLDSYPFVEDALRGLVALEPPPAVAPSEAAAARGLLDFAMRVDVPEPGTVLARLRGLGGAEARYHEANLLVAGGHLAEALETLEAAARGDFALPYYLPGFLLARLGQLRDLAGRREAATRAYRGVRALAYAPPEALAAAEAGLAAPFELAPPDGPVEAG